MIAAALKSALIFAAVNGWLPCGLVGFVISNTPLREA